VASRYLLPAGGAVVLVLALVTHARAKLYNDTEAMWRDVVASLPENPRGHINLGTELLISDPPRLGEAIVHFRAALAIDSTLASAWYNLGEAHVGQRKLNEAMQFYARALRENPAHVKALDRLGSFLVAGSAAREDDGKRLPSRDAAVRGLAYAEVRRGDLASPYLKRAIESAGGDARTYTLVGRALVALGALEESEGPLLRAIEMDERDAEALTALGVARMGMNDTAEARRYLTRALSIAPGYTPARRALESLGGGV
jgi:tetratricopeptide (TPR) repeat protein